MTKQDTRQSQMAREHVVFRLRITRSDASVTEPVYGKCILRWNSRFDHPGFCGGVCCLRGVTQRWAKNQERRKKGLQLHPRAHHHCREPSIHSTLAPNHSPVTTDNYFYCIRFKSSRKVHKSELETLVDQSKCHI